MAAPDTTDAGPDQPAATAWADAARAFGDRLAKRHRHLTKWARRAGVTCFRVYDADIPEVPLVVDWYDGRLHVAEYVKGEPMADDRRRAMLAAASERLDVAPERVHFKERARQRGKAQYEKLGDDGGRFVVTEGGHRFLVNLTDYLDTGLFLDHRPMRAMVEAEADGADVLNLFAYTGAFTVYAAAGGARTTTTVDLSATYLGWARENMTLNGFTPGERHRFVQADVLRWLAEGPADVFDHAVVDPPTFSNSKRMADVFDVQRDHVDLLRAVYRLVRPGGVVWFSTNHRRFRPAPEAFAGCARVDDLSERSVPPDFRNRRIHRAWRIATPGRAHSPAR